MHRRNLFLLVLLAVFFSLSLHTAPAQARALPGAFSLSSPAAGAIVANARPTFRWTISRGATNYRLQLLNSASQLVVNQLYTPAQAACANGTCQAAPPNNLPNGAYRWRVVALNASGRIATAYRNVTVRVVTRAQQMLTLVNQKRCAAGLTPLALNATLNSVAQSHSTRMRDLNFWSHDDPYSGLDPFERMRAAGYNYWAAAENIAIGRSTVQGTFDDWWNSRQGHKENMMNRNMREMGLGYAAGGSYGHYWTMTLGNRSGATGGRCP
jgi:uncharacterized protein YkwD